MRTHRVRPAGFIRCLMALALFGLSGCSPVGTSFEPVTAVKPELPASENETWNSMVGNWFGSQPTKQGGRREWLMSRFADGTYKATFRVREKGGRLTEQSEYGEWGVSGPIYFTVTKAVSRGGKAVAVDPADPYYRNAYRIVSLSETGFTYRNFGDYSAVYPPAFSATGRRFVVSRAAV